MCPLVADKRSNRILFSSIFISILFRTLCTSFIFSSLSLYTLDAERASDGDGVRHVDTSLYSWRSIVEYLVISLPVPSLLNVCCICLVFGDRGYDSWEADEKTIVRSS